MIKYIKLCEQLIYDFLLGFWTLFAFKLSFSFYACSEEVDIGTSLAIITIGDYLFLLITSNITFIRDNTISKKILYLITSFVLGIIFAIFLHKAQGIINTMEILILNALNIIYLLLNKKTKNLHIILLLIIDIMFCYYTVNYFLMCNN